MKRFSKQATSTALVAGVVLMIAALSGLSQIIETPMEDGIGTMVWDPIWWTNSPVAEACYPSQSSPDSGLYSEAIVGRDIVAMNGYPYHYALISGINDTLDALITFYNPPVPESDYILTGKKVEEWFAPQAYQPFVTNPEGPTFRDSTQLGFRMRGWSDGWKPIPAPGKLHSESWGYSDYGYCSVKLDIWNLPEGEFQVCILATDKAPQELHALTGGSMIEFYPARDLADSCNGYEGCYWRATYDTNFAAARIWVDKITDINPKSVPGWWLKAENALNFRDTSGAVAAYDSAIAFLNSGADPAMPDSSRGALRDLERRYIRWLQAILPFKRGQLVP